MSAITSNLNINKHKNKNIMKTKKTNTKKATSKKSTLKINTYATSKATMTVKQLFYKRKQSKETYSSTFDAEIAPGYMSYNVINGMVQHGRTGTITDNTNNNRQTEDLFIYFFREDKEMYKGKPVSANERAVGKFCELYMPSHIKVLVHQPIGKRPGKKHSMEADYVVVDTRTGWQMMVDVNGGQSRDGKKGSVFHGSKNDVDKYKDAHYMDLGFDARYVLNVYDQGKNQNVVSYKVKDAVDPKKYKEFKIIDFDAFKYGMMDMLKIMETANILKFDHKKFARTIKAAHDYVRNRRTLQKKNEMELLRKRK